MTETDGADFIELTADIVSAYVSNNSVPASDLPALISEVHSALSRVIGGAAPVSSSWGPAWAEPKPVTVIADTRTSTKTPR